MATQTLTGTLRQVRKARRLSQLELSLRLGISQRHVSFVEGGRAKPSRELLMAWLQELQAPMAVCNEAMLQAGYARQAPYDVIFIGGGVEEISPAITDQLADGGRMVAVVYDKRRVGKGSLFVRVGDVVSRREVFDAATPMLPGFERESTFEF